MQFMTQCIRPSAKQVMTWTRGCQRAELEKLCVGSNSAKVMLKAKKHIIMN